MCYFKDFYFFVSEVINFDYFTINSTYQFSSRNYMQNETLPGILGILFGKIYPAEMIYFLDNRLHQWDEFLISIFRACPCLIHTEQNLWDSETPLSFI